VSPQLALCAALCATLASGCGAGSTLEGSLSEDVSLQFDQVQLQRSTDAVALLYLRAVPGGTGNDIIFKLTATTTGLSLDAPVSIDLAEKIGTSTRGAAERVVSGDGRGALPMIARGTLHFSSAPAIGSSVSGNFNLLFPPGGTGTVGAGRTVFGNFSATVMGAM